MMDALCARGRGLVMLQDMGRILKECIKSPGRTSIWSPQLNKYVCTDTDEGKLAIALAVEANSKATHPPIDPKFKLIFVTAAVGTLLFVLLCVTLTIVVGREPPPLYEKVIMSLLDLAKIGFGAAVGLLGGKSLQGEAAKEEPPKTGKSTSKRQ
jgi:hypothetical protein